MPALRIPIVGSYTNRGAFPTQNSLNTDQVFVNCYPQVIENPVTKNGTVYLLKRPGSSASGPLTSSASLTGAALISWNAASSTLPVIVGGFCEVGSPTTSTSVWNINAGVRYGSTVPNTNVVDSLTETIINGTAYLVGYFQDSTTSAIEQWCLPEGGIWEQVVDSDFPTNLVGFPEHMDGYVFNMTKDGKIVNSDLNTVSTYTATNFITAGQSPDKGVTVAKLGAQIIAFGEKSIERFYNAGNATGSPLSRVQDGGIPIGAARRSNANPHTVIKAHGTIWWIATNSEGGVIGVYRFGDKGGPEKVSNAAIDAFLVGGQLFGFVGSGVLHGMRHVILRGIVGATIGAYAYCLETNYWWRLTLASGLIVGATSAGPSAVPSGNTYFLTTGNNRGNTFNSDDGRDDGVAFQMTVQTANMDLGTRRKKIWDAVSVIGDISTQAASQIQIAFSDDDFATFSTPRAIFMSTQQNRLTRWGASRRRAWQINHSSATPLRLEALEFEYRLGYP